MKCFNNRVRNAVALLGASAALAVAGVGGPTPACVTQFSLAGGACSKWVDTTDPEQCPDEVINSDECTGTKSATSGYSDRSGYWSGCTIRQKMLNAQGTGCLSINLPPKNYRCYEATGTPCGGGCGGC